MRIHRIVHAGRLITLGQSKDARGRSELRGRRRITSNQHLTGQTFHWMMGYVAEHVWEWPECGDARFRISENKQDILCSRKKMAKMCLLEREYQLVYIKEAAQLRQSVICMSIEWVMD